jgi:hypothetical protein
MNPLKQANRLALSTLIFWSVLAISPFPSRAESEVCAYQRKRFLAQDRHFHFQIRLFEACESRIRRQLRSLTENNLRANGDSLRTLREQHQECQGWVQNSLLIFDELLSLDNSHSVNCHWRAATRMIKNANRIHKSANTQWEELEREIDEAHFLAFAEPIAQDPPATPTNRLSSSGRAE